MIGWYNILSVTEQVQDKPTTFQIKDIKYYIGKIKIMIMCGRERSGSGRKIKVLEKCTKNLIGHSRLAFNNHESNIDC